jgi:hypothetical protein
LVLLKQQNGAFGKQQANLNRPLKAKKTFLHGWKMAEALVSIIE